MQCSRRTKSTILKIIAASIGIFAALGASQSAQATILFATSYEGKSLVKVDTSAMTTSTLFNTPSGPTGLIFDTSGRIIYTELVTGQVRRFDPNTNTDVLLASGLSTPLELTLEPGGNSVLVSDTNASKIDRIDLTTNALSTLTSDFLLPAGITYDSAGRLFVDTLAQVFELDPTTGAPLQSSRGLTNMNGLAFDSFTGDLFASSVEGVTIYQFSPGNLNSASTLTMDIRGPGGLVSDGLGNLFVASLFDSHIYQYNLATNTLTQNVFVAGLYDLALAPGLGTTPPPGVVPEPSSVALLMTGGLPLLGLLRRRLSA